MKNNVKSMITLRKYLNTDFLKHAILFNDLLGFFVEGVDDFLNSKKSHRASIDVKNT